MENLIEELSDQDIEFLADIDDLSEEQKNKVITYIKNKINAHISSARKEMKKEEWCHICDEMSINCSNIIGHFQEWWIKSMKINEVLGEK